MSTPKESLQKAIDLVGGQTALAVAISDIVDKKISQSHMWTWLNRDGRIPAEYCLAVERATNGGVTVSDLRPDIYPPERFYAGPSSKTATRAAAGIEKGHGAKKQSQRKARAGP